MLFVGKLFFISIFVDFNELAIMLKEAELSTLMGNRKAIAARAVVNTHN